VDNQDLHPGIERPRNEADNSCNQGEEYTELYLHSVTHIQCLIQRNSSGKFTITSILHCTLFR